MGTISENVKRIINEIPPYVKVVAATKTRSPMEVREAIGAGIRICGENYLQEAEMKISEIGKACEWHFIGVIQNRKIKRIVEIFDMVQSVESMESALAIDKWSGYYGKVLPVLFEVNIGEEQQKSGFLPLEVKEAIIKCSTLKNIRISGLMTMGPLLDEQEAYRPYFSKMKDIFEEVKSLNLESISMDYLSMGMSDSYKVAIEEGSNMIRLGTVIFGPRV